MVSYNDLSLDGRMAYILLKKCAEAHQIVLWTKLLRFIDGLPIDYEDDAQIPIQLGQVDESLRQNYYNLRQEYGGFVLSKHERDLTESEEKEIDNYAKKNNLDERSSGLGYFFKGKWFPGVDEGGGFFDSVADQYKYASKEAVRGIKNAIKEYWSNSPYLRYSIYVIVGLWVMMKIGRWYTVKKAGF